MQLTHTCMTKCTTSHVHIHNPNGIHSGLQVSNSMCRSKLGSSSNSTGHTVIVSFLTLVQPSHTAFLIVKLLLNDICHLLYQIGYMTFVIRYTRQAILDSVLHAAQYIEDACYYLGSMHRLHDVEYLKQYTIYYLYKIATTLTSSQIICQLLPLFSMNMPFTIQLEFEFFSRNMHKFMVV